MTALAIAPATSQTVRLPLHVSVVETRGRLFRIYAQLKAWQATANRHELREANSDFGQAPGSEKERASSYYNIAQKTAELVSCKLNLCSNEAYQKFKNHKIIAAYDSKGNLQGVAAVKLVNKKGVAAKIEYLVTAFWNMPFSSPLRSFATRGAGTCLVDKIAQIVQTPGALFVEPTADALDFYTKRGFILIEDWAPKTLGSVCGMALSSKSFEALHKMASEQSVPSDESTLPETNLHGIECLSADWRKAILSQPEASDSKDTGN